MSGRWHEFRLRVKALFVRRRLDRDMAEELAFHQAMLREKAMREGASTEEAAAAARKAFGNPSRWHERLRELWQFQPLENLLRDLSFSIRMLTKSPGFTLIAVLTLALGFGANLAIFSLMNALLLRPLPVPHSEQLVLVGLDLHRSFGLQYGLSAPMVRELEKQKDEFSGISGFSTDPEMQVKNTLGNQKVVGQFVTGQFFETLQTPPLLGRVLGREDDREGGNSSGWAVVISEGFWHRWFASEGHVVGRKLIINNVPFTVVGVMPQKFFGADPTHRPEFFVPLASEPVLHAPRSYIAMGDHAWWLTAIGRLRPSASLSSVNAELAARTMQTLRATQWDEDNLRDAEQHHHVFVAEPGARGYTYLRMAFGRPLTAIFAMCGGILLLSCVNLASLLLARSASRAQELATRLALGASRARLVRQLLLESLLIAVLGVSFGLAAAPVASRLLVTILIGNNLQTTTLDTTLDGRVWIFAILAAMMASVVIGMIPALRATSGPLQQGLRQGKTFQPGERHRWMPRVLLMLEVSLAIILLVCAGLLAASLLRLYRTGAGYDAHGVVAMPFDLDKEKLNSAELSSFYQQIGDGLRRQPGVKQVSFVYVMPMIGMQWTTELSSAHAKDQGINMNFVAPSYFDTLHIPLLQGRDFRWNDTESSGPKIILNKKAAQMLFGTEDAVGRTLTEPQGEGKPALSYEVVGVVSDTKYSKLTEDFSAIAYFALSQSASRSSYFAVVKTSGPETPLVAAARDIAHRLAPDIPAPAMVTMDSILDDSISSERMMAMLSAYFAACALLVTAIGLYGTLSYETARRTSEIGIRMALGAQRGQVVRMVFQENAWVAVSGAAAGLVLALLGARLLASFLYQTSDHDPWVIVVSVCALVGVACGASLAPAVKAAYVDPMVAIRHE